MLQGQSHDDVLELCRTVHMDPSTYKTFDFALTTQTNPSLEAAKDAQAETVTESVTASESGSSGTKTGAVRSTVPTEVVNKQPFAPEPAVTNEITDALVEQEPVPFRPTFLQFREKFAETITKESTGTNLSALAAVHHRAMDRPDLLPVVPGVGGCGATTVLAGLGRALSILGERVLVVDSPGPSTLDFFYQSNTVKTNLLLSTDPLSQFEGAVHVLRTHVDTPSGGQSYSTKFCRATAGLSGHVDRILVAGAEWFAPALQKRTWSGGVCLFVLTPDMRSVMAVPSILQAVAERSRKTGCNVEPWFLLNRFNESSPVHANIRSRLSAQLGSRLLPFHIPESELIEQALMHGTNVLDLAPESSFSDACFNLAEWYRTTSERTARLSSPAEENQLVSERS